MPDREDLAGDWQSAIPENTSIGEAIPDKDLALIVCERSYLANSVGRRFY